MAALKQDRALVQQGRMYAGKEKQKEFNTANKKEKEGEQWLGQSDGGRGVVEQSGNEMGHLHLVAASAPPPCTEQPAPLRQTAAGSAPRANRWI